MISPLRRGRKAGRLTLSLGTARRLLLLMIAVLATGSMYLRVHPHEAHELASALPRVSVRCIPVGRPLDRVECGHVHCIVIPPIAPRRELSESCLRCCNPAEWSAEGTRQLTVCVWPPTVWAIHSRTASVSGARRAG
jgi:hypothetical protein